MASNFARALLTKAKLELSGDDEMSWKSRRAIDLLIGAIMTEEYASPRPPAEIISFELAVRQRQGVTFYPGNRCLIARAILS